MTKLKPLRTSDPMLEYCDQHPDTGDELQEWYRAAYKVIGFKDSSECSDEELVAFSIIAKAVDLLVKYSGRDFRMDFWKGLHWDDLTSWADAIEKLQDMEGKATD